MDASKLSIVSETIEEATAVLSGFVPFRFGVTGLDEVVLSANFWERVGTVVYLETPIFRAARAGAGELLALAAAANFLSLFLLSASICSAFRVASRFAFRFRSLTLAMTSVAVSSRSTSGLAALSSAS